MDRSRAGSEFRRRAMRSPMRTPQCGWFRKTSATCGARSGCPSSSTPRDSAAWTGCARAGATPIRGLGSAVAIPLLPQEHVPRLGGLFSGCPTVSKGGRSPEGPLASSTCETTSSAPHCGFPTRRGCPFGWSVGRCSSRWCEAARGRLPGNVPNLPRCAARRPRRQGWSLWAPSRPQASGTSNAIARATPQTFSDPGCCRSRSPRCGSLASSCPQARRTTKVRATRQGRRPNRGNAGAVRGCRCACGRRQRWHGAPTR